MGLLTRTRLSIGLAAIVAMAFAAWFAAAADKPAADKPADKKSKSGQNQPAENESAPAKDDSAKKSPPAKDAKKDPAAPARTEEATFGSGCFWCGEAVFEQLKGVTSVVVGYSGGTVENPTYEDVSTDLTGHAEVMQITFDPDVISFDDLLDVFWKSHDPTKLNEQGPDHGTRYRSVIFYHSDEQKELAEKSKQKHMKPGRTAPRIVTEITKFSAFYPAEDYHQDFFKKNPQNAYCKINARPKMNKVKKDFKDLIKEPPAKK